jgi:hypothetical protein
MSSVSRVIRELLPANNKTTPSGWVSFSAPCCHHLGHKTDKKMRGGILESNDVFRYHCFNCGFKAGWEPGHTLSRNMRNLLQWLGASDDMINKLSLAVLKLNQHSDQLQHVLDIPQFNTASLPEGSIPITGEPCKNPYLNTVKQYIKSRGLKLDQGYCYYWNPSLNYRDRFFIPFVYRKRTVGWTARSVKLQAKTKYLMQKPPGFVFNLDQQTHDRTFCIVAEGALDAIHVHGAALLTNEINAQQALLLNQLNRKIIVVPDRDQSGRNLVERSIELGYAVSMPPWHEGIKDISDASVKYGALYTLYSIVKNAESNALKIRLKEKQWFANCQ